MTDIDLDATWDAAKEGFSAPDYVGLVKAGVPKAFLAAQLYRSLWIGADDIAIDGRRWVRRFRGDRAIVLPVLSPESGELLDLVAFRLETPRSYWSFSGAAPMLGYASLERAIYFQEPLFVHESPLDWLKASMTGIVILDWARYWPGYVAEVPALRMMDEGFGRRVRALLQRPLPIPEIQVAA